jgi:hypothetical protein
MSDEDSRRKLRIPFLLNQTRQDTQGPDPSSRDHPGATAPLPPTSKGPSQGQQAAPAHAQSPHHASVRPGNTLPGISSSTGVAGSSSSMSGGPSSSHHRGSGRSTSSHSRGGATAGTLHLDGPPRHKLADPAHEASDPEADKRRYVCDRPNCGYRFKQRGGKYRVALKSLGAHWVVLFLGILTLRYLFLRASRGTCFQFVQIS